MENDELRYLNVKVLNPVTIDSSSGSSVVEPASDAVFTQVPYTCTIQVNVTISYGTGQYLTGSFVLPSSTAKNSLTSTHIYHVKQCVLSLLEDYSYQHGERISSALFSANFVTFDNTLMNKELRWFDGTVSFGGNPEKYRFAAVRNSSFDLDS